MRISMNEVNNQINTINRVISNKINALQLLKNSINDIDSKNIELQSTGYNSLREHTKNTYVPLIQKLIDNGNEIINKNNEYQNLFYSMVDSSADAVIDSSRLGSLVSRVNRYNDIIREYKMGSEDVSISQYINAKNNVISIQEVINKIEDLKNFNNKATKLYSAAKDNNALINNKIASINKIQWDPEAFNFSIK